jgi:tRNA(Met) cytidine acetyltransferase
VDLQQALLLRKRLAGDGLWVGPQPMEAPCISPEALKSLLGRGIHHAFLMPAAALTRRLLPR